MTREWTRIVVTRRTSVAEPAWLEHAVVLSLSCLIPYQLLFVALAHG